MAETLDSAATKTPPADWTPVRRTARLMLADGTQLDGFGIGTSGIAIGEVCFNTAMTGYQEIMTDPSYAGQIITFTFPHIGNVGTNAEDREALADPDAPREGAVGCIIRAPVTDPSNWRAADRFDAWLKTRGMIGLYGVDTRALTALIRDKGMPNAALAHAPDGVFDNNLLLEKVKAWGGLEGRDLVPGVTSPEEARWSQTPWVFGEGFGTATDGEFHVVAVDFGVKRNILRLLADRGCRITVVPGDATADQIMALKPDGVFLSNGPGDPAATGEYAGPTIRALIDTDLPVFGICLGHQVLGLALGGRTMKMHQGHHGANHPVMDYTTGKVEITSMNHGFAVDASSLPDGVEVTHTSLFDGSNCGLRLVGKPVFSVQHHPEASPGPQDSHYLFDRFVELMREHGRQTA